VTTPKRNEAVAFASASQLEALDKCRGDEHNGTVEVWMRATDTHDQALYSAETVADLQGEVSRLREDAAMFRWLTRYPNLYTVADLLKSDQYVTLRRACESLMPTDPDNLEPPTDVQ
jgi:hypothetical protein